MSPIERFAMLFTALGLTADTLGFRPLAMTFAGCALGLIAAEFARGLDLVSIHALVRRRRASRKD